MKNKKLSQFQRGFKFDELVVFIDLLDIHADALYYNVDDQKNIIKSPRYEQYLKDHTDPKKIIPSRYSITLKVIELVRKYLTLKPSDGLNEIGSRWTINSKLFRLNPITLNNNNL